MKIVGRVVLDEFSRKDADVASQLASWLSEAQESEWKSPNEIKARFPHASFLSGNRVVFNIKGNHYRLEMKINYVSQVILIKRVGTHAEYSKWIF